jgi:hypothetical protein
MSRITLTIHIDMPDGVTPDVEYSEKAGAEAPRTAPAPAQAAEPTQLPPWPPEERSEAPQQPTVGPMAWPPGDCPKHKRPWKDGKYGPFCSAKDESTSKGFCEIKPGVTWNGKKVPAVTVAA